MILRYLNSPQAYIYDVSKFQIMSFFQGTFLTGTKWITAPDQVNGVLNRARAKKQQNCLFLLKKNQKNLSLLCDKLNSHNLMPRLEYNSNQYIMPPSLSNLLTQDKFEDEQEKRIIILLLYNSETSLSVCVCVCVRSHQKFTQNFSRTRLILIRSQQDS